MVLVLSQASEKGPFLSSILGLGGWGRSAAPKRLGAPLRYDPSHKRRAAHTGFVRGS